MSTVWLALDQIVFVWQKLPEQTKLVHLQFVKFTWPRRVDLLPPYRYRVLRNLPSRSLQKNRCMIIHLTTSQSTCAIFRDLSKSLLITKGSSSKLNFTKSERTITTRQHTGLKVNQGSLLQPIFLPYHHATKPDPETWGSGSLRTVQANIPTLSTVARR